MCGINGMVMLKGVERSPEMMAKIRYVFSEIMIETQDRGEHATGLAHFYRDGRYDFHKKDINAEKMTTEDEQYLSIISNFDSENTSAIIAHTRYLTKGKASNNNNNHPFDIGNVVGLHNGSVKNDDDLFKKYENKFKRVGEVDSEVIYQLINHYNKQNITFSGLKSALEDTKIRGLFALAFVHKNQPNLVHLVKQEKPMDIAYWKEAGVVIFNSVDTYIKNAFRRLERVGLALGVGNTKQTVEYVTVKNDTYFTLDSNATTLELAISEPTRIYLETSSKTYTGTDWSGGTTTSWRSAKSNTTSTKEVTAKDSKGLVLTGEIDTITGEVIIYSEDISSADDGSGLLDEEGIEVEECVECGEWMDEEEIQTGFNLHNPTGEKVCRQCYEDTMNSMFADDEREEHILDCDGHKVG
jgi:glucosamine 6-phosphate synthetase-like amidotransferase/phosphosugar isomerase protein